MDVLRRALGDWSCPKIRFPFGPKKCKEKPNRLSKYEYYVYKFQSIVIWEHPTQTVSCLLLIQLLFWMIVNLCWKFYGILFTLLLIFCTHDVWTEKIWPEIRLPQPDAVPYQQEFSSDPRILTTGQIEEYFNNLLLHAKMTLIRFKNLRSSHPTLFCAMFTTGLTLLAAIGCTISGIWLLYMIVMTIFLSPGVYIYVLPEYLKNSLKQYFHEYVINGVFVVTGAFFVDDDDDYVPLLSEGELDEAYASVFQLNDVSNDFLSIDKDDLPNVDAFPSFDDTSLDELDRLSDVTKSNFEFSETSSIASDASAERMKFQGEHFDNEQASELDLTSEEEHERAFLPDPQYRRKASDSSTLGAFVSGLNLPDFHKLSENLFNLIPSSSTSQVQRKTTPPRPSNYNTDDEFEFVNESDLN